MSDWIFLSKGGQDEYIMMMAQGSGGTVTNTDDFRYEDSAAPLVLRGILKHKIMQRCWQDHREFYYMDTGYLGNNRAGKKLWHRIVRNDLQHGDIVTRPADRWQKLKISTVPRRRGRRIILAMPDDKPCRFYGVDRETWKQSVLQEIAQHTDRPVIVRERHPERRHRLTTDPLCQVLAQDVHALVTFNSVAATEAIINGVPAFTLAPANAARPVANTDLARIEDPWWPDPDLIHTWACHLAYGQFHVRELRDGTAYRILNGH
jgi:hypothetical protein